MDEEDVISKSDPGRRTAVTPNSWPSRKAVLEVSRIKAAYEQILGRKVRNLQYIGCSRHGWRKGAPAPPPKADSATRRSLKTGEIVEQEVVRQGQQGRQLRLMFRMRHVFG